MSGETDWSIVVTNVMRGLQNKVLNLQKEIKELKEQNITMKKLLVKRQNSQTHINKEISFIKHKISEIITHITLLKNKLKK